MLTSCRQVLSHPMRDSWSYVLYWVLLRDPCFRELYSTCPDFTRAETYHFGKWAPISRKFRPYSSSPPSCRQDCTLLFICISMYLRSCNSSESLLNVHQLSGAFSGLLAAAIQNMDGIGGRPGWAWIFILVSPHFTPYNPSQPPCLSTHIRTCSHRRVSSPSSWVSSASSSSPPHPKTPNSSPKPKRTSSKPASNTTDPPSHPTSPPTNSPSAKSFVHSHRSMSSSSSSFSSWSERPSTVWHYSYLPS